jgi:hypothetical protein
MTVQAEYHCQGERNFQEVVENKRTSEDLAEIECVD